MASARPAAIVKERVLGPVFESLSDVHSGLVPRILTDRGGSNFIQSGVGSTAVSRSRSLVSHSQTTIAS